MERITKITICNVKGTAHRSYKFDDLVPNKVNLFVAPNGYGKSTLTAAFKAASNGAMKLQNDEYFKGNKANIPSLEIEYSVSHKTEKVKSDNIQGEISRKFVVYCINSPVIAKSTSRNMGKFSTRSAELRIDEINVCKIPEKIDVIYKYQTMRNLFGTKTPNLTDFFSSIKVLKFVVDNQKDIIKCLTQTKLVKFLEDVDSDNVDSVIEKIEKYPTLQELISKLVSSCQVNHNDALRYVIQITQFVQDNHLNEIKSALEYLIYKNRKTDISKRLQTFNTTGQNIKVAKQKENLVLKLGSARKMSNGERDILYFVVSLVSFEFSVKSKPAILIIDEVFDYLDGGNLLAAQYYLSKMITLMKSQHKIFFPIIMTHLDPAVFSNYYIKGMKVHYLTSYSSIANISSDKIVNLLILRSDLKKKDRCNVLAGNIEKHLLHYYPDNWAVDDVLKEEIPEFWVDSFSYRDGLKQEVYNYFNDAKYNALAVVIAIRIKVEELTVNKLPEDKRSEYYNKKGAKQKLSYAEECNIELPELCSLLCPIYNDTLHLYKDEPNVNLNKIEGSYLKLSSNVVKNIIKELFEI